MSNQKIVLITGCSSGFGLLISKALSTDKNYKVYSSMRNLAKQDKLQSEIKKINGQINLLEIDVTKTETIKNAICEIKKREGKIDILVNNAGHAMGGFFEDLSDEEIREQLEVNFFGMQSMIRESLPLLFQSKNAKIINISSIAGLISYPGLGAYNASKWAVEGFSESLRSELSRFGINVSLVEPGSFETSIFKENAKFCTNHNNCESRYFQHTQYLIFTRIEKINKLRGNPQKVADKVVKIISQKNPKFRNIVGIDAKFTYFLKKFLPFTIFEKLVDYVAFKNLKK